MRIQTPRLDRVLRERKHKHERITSLTVILLFSLVLIICCTGQDCFRYWIRPVLWSIFNCSVPSDIFSLLVSFILRSREWSETSDGSSRTSCTQCPSLFHPTSIDHRLEVLLTADKHRWYLSLLIKALPTWVEHVGVGRCELAIVLMTDERKRENKSAFQIHWSLCFFLCE